MEGELAGVRSEAADERQRLEAELQKERSKAAKAERLHQRTREDLAIAEDEPEIKIGADGKEYLGPLHKRCPHCQMVMLKKNLSRHIRDQHSMDRPRSTCPICTKSYKTPDWLKDHVRRGHGYTKEATDELLARLKLDSRTKSPSISPVKTPAPSSTHQATLVK